MTRPDRASTNSVDAVIISNSVAFDGGLNVLKDSIYHETINKNTRYNINIIATAKKNENNKEYKNSSNSSIQKKFKNTSAKSSIIRKSRSKSRFLI